VLGPATVIEAVAQGNKVALSVDSFLQEGEPESKEAWLSYRLEPEAWDPEEYATAQRPEMPTQDPEKRVGDFSEIEQGLSEGVARAEACRCLRCDLEREAILAAEAERAAAEEEE
jgi:hypothetical protein